MNKTQTQRLQKLHDHLVKGQLNHTVFDFAKFHSHTGCGTAGCALGEAPYLFPDDWQFVQQYGMTRPVLKGLPPSNFRASHRAAMQFFGISSKAADHLFFPRLQTPKLYGGVVLTGRASKEEVARNIRLFIKRQGK